MLGYRVIVGGGSGGGVGGGGGGGGSGGGGGGGCCDAVEWCKETQRVLFGEPVALIV